MHNPLDASQVLAKLRNSPWHLLRDGQLFLSGQAKVDVSSAKQITVKTHSDTGIGSVYRLPAQTENLKFEILKLTESGI